MSHLPRIFIKNPPRPFKNPLLSALRHPLSGFIVSVARSTPLFLRGWCKCRRRMHAPYSIYAANSASRSSRTLSLAPPPRSSSSIPSPAQHYSAPQAISASIHCTCGLRRRSRQNRILPLLLIALLDPTAKGRVVDANHGGKPCRTHARAIKSGEYFLPLGKRRAHSPQTVLLENFPR